MPEEPFESKISSLQNLHEVTFKIKGSKYIKGQD